MTRRLSRDEDDLPLSPVRRVDDDVRGEIEFHIEQRAAELRAQGMPAEQALREARALFGDRAGIEAECRTIERRRRVSRWRGVRLRALRQDLVVGLRLLRKTPAFTAAAILTLAVGIGANTAVFSIVNQTILQPLDYVEPDRLVRVSERHGAGGGSVPWATFLDLERDARSFTAMAAYGSGATSVLGAKEPMRVEGAAVSSAFFRVFPVRLHMGRLPLPDEHREGATPVIMVSHAFWRDRLGAPATLNGVQLRLDRDHAVVGVLPPGFDYPNGAQLWVPLELMSQSMSRTAHNWEVVGRMRDGVTASAAERELGALLDRMRPLYAPDFDATGAMVQPLQAALTGGVRKPLLLLLGASTVLLLAACTNVASAQLARGTARAGELAVRASLGASRMRLVRQLLTESALLAVLGGTAGLVLARLLLVAFSAVAPDALHIERVRVDVWVQGFAMLVALGTAALFGLYPALRLSEATTTLALREGGRGAIGGRLRAWNVLVAGEIALAAMLLTTSVVLGRSFAETMQVDLGFDPAGLTTAKVHLPAVNYPDRSTETSAFHDAVLGRVREAAGIDAVGFANMLPLEGGFPSGALEVEGKPLDAGGRSNGHAVYRVIGGSYFAALGVPLMDGRVFRAGDDAAAARVVVVDAEFARRQWPGQRAIGKRVRPFGMDSGDTEPWFTVIGVVGSTRADAITAPYRETYYFDHRQRPAYRSQAASYVVRSTLGTAAVSALLRREITAIDPQVPVEASTMGRIVARTVEDRRFTMLLVGVFAGMALVLAIAGIYAVVSYSVAQRTREIGVRLALGASPAQVRGLVVASALTGILPGLALGAALSLASVRALRSMLTEITDVDPLALAIAIALLAVIGVLACIVPAQRATRVDPLIAMRAE